MPRAGRRSTGGFYYHVLNRGNARAEVFHERTDYQAFLDLMGQACQRVPMRILAWCLMPNHFHTVLWPRGDGDLPRWMQWLTTAHVRRHHVRYGSTGHVWQGRYKSFPVVSRPVSREQRAGGTVEAGPPLWIVVRYVEQNPLRAGLVARAEDWPWSSLMAVAHPQEAPAWVLGEWLNRPDDWLEWVNALAPDAELTSVRRCIGRGCPFTG